MSRELCLHAPHKTSWCRPWNLLSSFFLLIWLPGIIQAEVVLPVGARTAGMAGTHLAASNRPDAIWLNASGMTSTMLAQLSLYYTNPYNLPNIYHGAVSLVVPLRSLTTGFGMQTYGLQHGYQRGIIALALSKRLSCLRFSITLLFHTLHIAGYGSANSCNINSGIVMKVNPKLNLGLTVHGIRLAGTNDYAGSPGSLQIGFGYKISQDIRLGMDLFKEPAFRYEKRLGIEVNIFRILAVRGGLANNPERICGGIGIQLVAMTIDYATVNHPELGFSHRFSITFNLRSGIR